MSMRAMILQTILRWRMIGALVAVVWSGMCLSASVDAGLADTPGSEDAPNIVLIMTDDQGYGDLGVHGNPILQTPSMDRLAQDSATMKTFYVCPVCSPTRAGLMTGRYHYRTRVVDTYKGRSMMEPDEQTLAEILRKAGYATGIFGKWHLGDCYPMRPMDQGFDESLVHRGGGLAQPSEPIANDNRYTNPILIHNGEKTQMQGYCTDVYFDAAADFIGQAVEQDKPFFVYLPTNAPHGPFHDVPQELYEKYRQMDLQPVLLDDGGSADRVARAFAMIENIDNNVGRLLARLDSLGVDQDTIVILMFDNGPNTRRFVGNMRGMKGEVHDGGIRSPFYMRWPRRISAGNASDRVAAYIDVLPTLLDAAGIPIPEDIDGLSLLPLLEGNRVGPWPDRSIVIQAHRGNRPQPYHHFALRQQRWKLVCPSGFGRQQRPQDASFELYDMQEDPREQNELSEDRPQVVRDLLAEYDAWFRDVSSTRPNNYAAPRIVVGTDHETQTVLTRQDWRVTDEGGWGRNGRWLLDFRGDHVYRVELRWPKPIEPGEIQLTVGSLQQVAQVKEATDRVEFDGLAIPAGKAALGAILQHGENTTDAYHVILTRVPSS